MHPNSLLLFEKYAKPLFKSNTRVLEIGPNESPSPYRKLIPDETITWETIDICQVPGVTHVARSEYEFPMADNTYDIVCSGNVIEHVKKIWVWMQEISRVLKPGGMVITVNPVSWPFHEAPVDCWRIYPDGMRALYDYAGMDTKLAVHETIQEPMWQPSGYYLVKQGIKKMLGRSPWFTWKMWPIVDTIAVGVKR